MSGNFKCAAASTSGNLAAAVLGDGEHGGTRRHLRIEVRPAGRRVLEGRWAAKADQRLGPVCGRMLHGDEQRFAVGREAGTAQLGANGAAEKELRGPAARAVGLKRIEPV